MLDIVVGAVEVLAEAVSGSAEVEATVVVDV